MLDIFLDSKYLVGKDITAQVLKRVADRKPNENFAEYIKSVTWIASIRPHETGLISFEDDTRRYEEIQILEVELLKHEVLSSVAYTIMSVIPYPILLILSINGKYKACISKATKNKHDYEKLVTRSVFQTSWFFPFESDNSNVTTGILQALDFPKNDCCDIYELHSALFTALLYYKARWLTKAAVGRIVEWLGMSKTVKRDRICKDCSPIVFYPPEHVVNGFVRRRSSSYRLLHDTEDVWRALIRDEHARKIIAYRRISNMEELIFRSDEYERI